MALYDDAKIIFLASAAAGLETKDASKAYSVKPTNGNADFTISRDANLDATRVGPTGLIEKGRENLFRNTVFAGAGLDTEPTGGSKFIDSTGGTFNVTSTAGQLRFITASDERAFIQSHSVTTASLYSFSVFVDEVVTTLAVNKVISDSGEATDIRYEEDGVEISTSTNVQAGKRYTMVVSKTNTNSTRFRIGSGTASRVAGDVTLSKPQLEVGIVATDYIENTSTSGSATAGIKEDEPRFDYPLAGGAPSLLIEPQRKNEVPNSEGVVENTNDVTLTVNHGIAPDGTKSSLKVAKGGADANDRIQPISNDNVTLTNSTDYSISAFVKNIDCTGVTTLACRTDAGSSELFRQGFQWTGASLALTSDQASGTRTGAFVESYGNDWWRIGFTFTANSTAGDFELDIDRANPTATTSIETWGWQLEKETNGGMVTSYIPCHGAAATRSQDVFPEVTHGITLGTAVTVLLEARLFGGGGQVSFLQLRVDDNNRFLFFSNGYSLDSTHDINVQHRESTNNKAINKTGLTRGDIFKCIGRVDGTTFNFFVNGVKLSTTQTLGAATDIYDKISFIRNGDTTNQSGHKNKSVVVWASALTDQQCIDLTTL